MLLARIFLLLVVCHQACPMLQRGPGCLASPWVQAPLVGLVAYQHLLGQPICYNDNIAITLQRLHRPTLPVRSPGRLRLLHLLGEASPLDCAEMIPVSCSVQLHTFVSFLDPCEVLREALHPPWHA